VRHRGLPLGRAAGALGGVLLLAVSASAAAPRCAPLGPAGEARITTYLRGRFHFAPGFHLDRAVAVAGTCYLRLEFTDPPAGRRYLFFLAPDRRFLTAALYDTRSAASAGSGRRALDAELLAAPAPARGPAGAAVTLVEFSDFECPFCRRLAAFERALPARDAARLRIVFRFFPLTSIHPWALTAAKAAGCAYLQSNRAFWRAHDYFFTHQESLNPADAASVIRSVLARAPGFDLPRYDRCIRLGESVGLVQRDQRLGQRLGVSATPTFFVNGRRYVGIASQAALESAVSAAAAGTGRPRARAITASRKP
jgi:protein-disulfide isomerase